MIDRNEVHVGLRFYRETPLGIEEGRVVALYDDGKTPMVICRTTDGRTYGSTRDYFCKQWSPAP